MKIVNIDDLKKAYKEALEKNLIDDKRGIDLSEHAEEPAKLFNDMLDNLTVTDVLDKIKADIFNACSDNYHMPVYKLSCDEIFNIIDKYKESEGE